VATAAKVLTMAVQVTVPYEKTFSSSRDLEDTFKYLSDFERSIPENFKGIEKFEKQSDGSYLWEFEKIGHSGYNLEIRLIADCTAKPPKNIEITSRNQKGYAQFTGRWELTSGFENCQVKFTASFGLELPIPFLMKAVAVPLATKEFTKFFDRYIQRVEQTLAE
jgi:carbon monoxide dehydrogenase subunit G